MNDLEYFPGRAQSPLYFIRKRVKTQDPNWQNVNSITIARISNSERLSSRGRRIFSHHRLCRATISFRNEGVMSVVRWTSVLIFLAYPLAASGAEAARSHPPLRVAPPPSDRPLAQGPGYYADAQKGADANDGSAAKPWKTVRHALSRLKAGDTLYLQGGTYYENVYLALRGTKDAAITIRSAPNEQAILDGGWSEFYEKPAEAWEPEMKGAPGEYRSKISIPTNATSSVRLAIP